MQRDIPHGEAPPVWFIVGFGVIIALCVTLIILAVEQGISDFRRWRKRKSQPAGVDAVLLKPLDHSASDGRILGNGVPRRVQRPLYIDRA